MKIQSVISGEVTAAGRQRSQDRYGYIHRGNILTAVVADGHGDAGEHFADAVVDRILTLGATATDAGVMSHTQKVQDGLTSVQNDLAKSKAWRKLNGGTGVTVAVVGREGFSTTWIGDVGARYYTRNVKKGMALTAPHDGSNEAEVQRVLSAGHEVRPPTPHDPVHRFGGHMMVSRAIGDFAYEFMDAGPESYAATAAEGALLLSSDGVITPRTQPHVDRFMYNALSKNTADPTLAQVLVEEFTQFTGDDATALIINLATE